MKKLIAILFFATSCVSAATYTVYIHAPSQAVASDFIASTTSQFYGPLSKSASFANTWTIDISSRNPNWAPTPPPDFLSAHEVLQALISVSSSTYPYGWADGIEYGRGYDLSRISYYVVNCSTPSVFNASTATWNAGVCTDALMAAETDVYNTKFSSPTVVPGY